MKVTLNLLKEFVNLDEIELEQISNRLTFAGIEVEEYYPIARGTNLVVGEVIVCDIIEGTHLHLCKVNCGAKHGIRQIVCGAPNVRVGLKVIVALPGAILGELTIKDSVVRGFESHGMLCSLLELGVDVKDLSDKQKEGIEELPSDFLVGTENVLEVLGLDDIVFNLSILPNRPDILGVYNIALELGTLFNREVKSLTFPSVVSNGESIQTSLKTRKCSKLSAQIVRNIVVQESPKWLQETLIRLGYRPINNIVDISNYVMVVLNQPIHMYDLDLLPKLELSAEDGIVTKVNALDDKTYDTVKDDICITSDGIPQCLAGVMGLVESSISNKSTNIVIEVATFDNIAVRKTSSRLNLISESSIRNSRGNNPYRHPLVFSMVDNLIKELCPSATFGEIATSSDIKPYNNNIRVSAKYINNRLGTHLNALQIEKILVASGCLVARNKENLVVTPPDYRLDLLDKVDISEEVIRISGFEILDDETLQLNVKESGLSKAKKASDAIRNMLLPHGVNEVISYTLVSKEMMELGRAKNEKPLELLNPISENRQYLRVNLMSSLLEIASYNAAHQQKDISIFEISDLYLRDEKRKNLGILLAGEWDVQSKLEKKGFSYYHAKGILDAILEMFNVSPNRVKIQRLDSNNLEFHPQRSTDVLIDKKHVCRLGELHPFIVKKYKLPKSAVYLELRLDILFGIATPSNHFSSITRFPVVERDLAFVVDVEVEVGAIFSEINKLGSKIVRDATLFDCFELGNGSKSVAFRIVYGDNDKTLQDQEIRSAEQIIIEGIIKRFNASLRDGS